jgi:hypothetical protein
MCCYYFIEYHVVINIIVYVPLEVNKYKKNQLCTVNYLTFKYNLSRAALNHLLNYREILAVFPLY